MELTTKLNHKRIFANNVAHQYVTVGEGRPLILIHGFPQNWLEWKPLILLLSEKFKLIIPNLRGIGGAPGPATGYDKHSLASDIRAIVETECGNESVFICGHDIGAYVAFAYALKYRNDVHALFTVDAPLPGTKAMDQVMVNPRTWHIAFHSNPDVAQMLISGREHTYIDYFIKSRIYDFAAITPEDIKSYAATYSLPGALRAAFEMYRELPKDREMNLTALKEDGKLQIPVIALGSSSTTTKPLLQEMLDEISFNNYAVLVKQSGHWIPEEQPGVLAQIILETATKI